MDFLTHPLFISFLVSVGVLAIIPAVMCNYLIFLERKIAAWMQMRIGPNRVGPWGLFQPIADGLKFFFKEQIIPDHVNRWLYIMAPGIAAVTAFLAFAVVPFGATSTNPNEFQWVVAPGVNIGILYLFAVTSLAVYAILLGGWASNNKYSFLGALRSSAQVISYEIPLGMSILGVVLLTGSLNLEDIIHYQASRGILGWNVLYQPLAFLIFFIAAMAETNRLPFDLPECEQELIGGYHTEYSALKLAFFFLGEYTHMITVSLLVSILFLGGWHFPGIATMGPNTAITVGIKFVVLFSKMALFILIMMFIRWTIPRFRFDQLMVLAWTGLIPLALGNFVLVMFAKQFQWPLWLLTIGSVLLFLIPGYYGTRMPSDQKSRRLEPVAVTE
jgi:NADH-quinone oxidoreductase subunit H